jgi:hypothetical protein
MIEIELSMRFAGMTNPHLPSWNKQESGVVPVAMSSNCSLPGLECAFHNPRVLSPVDAAHEDTGWRNRSAGVVDVRMTTLFQ